MSGAPSAGKCRHRSCKQWFPSELQQTKLRQHLIREGTQHQDFFADVNVTLRVALERSVVESAAPVPAEFVQLFADVNVTLRIALERSVVDPLA